MPSIWQGPIVTLGLIGLIGLAAGGIFGAQAGWMTFAILLLLMVIHHIINRALLLKWLQKPDPAHIPDATGQWEEVFAALYRLIKNQRQSQQSLSERLDSFRQAASAMPDGIVILDVNHRIEWCNPGAEEHFGIDLEKDNGQQITYLVRQPDFNAYLTAQNYREPLNLKGLRTQDQSLSVQLVPYGEDKKLIMSRDISRWERIETMRRDFLANVSHELRTPLTVVGGFLETLTDLEDAEPAVVRRSLQLMTEQTGRMQRLVEDLLTLSRLESNHRSPGDDLINMPLLLQSLLNDAQHLSRGHHQITMSECEDVWLKGAEDELRSALGNLISNAVRYTPNGGSVQIKWRTINHEAVFSVTDTGVGIAPEHIPRLTERFYRVDRSRSRETGGTGLGLAIAKHVLSRHQARLEIHSTPGEGSTFSAHFLAIRIAEPKNPPAAALHAL
ncbi:MAG: phosphate regulon sensor histidine kinase PhoR [Pseudomonadota bacterium]